METLRHIPGTSPGKLTIPRRRAGILETVLLTGNGPLVLWRSRNSGTPERPLPFSPGYVRRIALPVPFAYKIHRGARDDIVPTSAAKSHSRNQPMSPDSTHQRFPDLPGRQADRAGSRSHALQRFHTPYLLMMAVSALLASTGCPDRESEQTDEDEPSMAGAVVPLWVPRELNLADHWGISVTEAEAETGAVCEFHEFDSTDALIEGLEHTGDGALVVCPLQLVPRLSGDVDLAPIPDDLTGGWHDVFDGLRNSIGSPGGKPTLFPLSAPPLICCYRADLLEQAGLAPPATWGEYRQLVATVKDWAPGLVVVEPWSPEFRATMFLQRSAAYALHPDNFSFTFDVSNGAPLIDQPPFVRALSEVQMDLDRLDPASLSIGPGECFLRVAQGDAALAIGRLPEAGQGGEAGSAIAEGPVSIGIQSLPGAPEVFHSREQAWSDVDSGHPNSVTVVGGDAWILCVAGNSDPVRTGHAWRLWNAIDDLERQSSRPGIAFQSGCRPSDVAARRGDTGLSTESQQQYVAAVTRSLRSNRVVAELPVPGHSGFRELLTQRLSEALEEGRDPDATLQDLAGDWRQLSDELGASSVLNTYRWSLGLSPLPAD